jgi:hypothetical protein
LVVGGMGGCGVAATTTGAWWAFHNAHTANDVVRSSVPVQRNLTPAFDPGYRPT